VTGTVPRPHRPATESPSVTRPPAPTRTAPVLFGLVLSLSACTLDLSAPAATDGPCEDLTCVQVLTGNGTEPTLRPPAPFSVTTTRRRVLRAGTGNPVSAGQRVDVRYVGANGSTGRRFDDSWDDTPRTLLLDPAQNLPGLVTGLLGTRVGSRVLVAVPPAEGYGLRGSTAHGIGPADTLVFVVDVLKAHSPLTRATGKPLPARPGLPTVTRGPSGRPTIAVPSLPAPRALVSQPLIEGTGPTVRAGHAVTVHYTGVVWDDGHRFDSSWDRGHPDTFTIGTGDVIAGWERGLPGHRVGSQLLLIVPPQDGFGPSGRPEVHVEGPHTLVFVIDILDID
jgi:peptidylprolyl isomerase